MYQAANAYTQLHHLHLPFQLLDVLQLVIAPSSLQPPLSGTSFLKKSDLPHHYQFSEGFVQILEKYGKSWNLM